jgi:hypothetical protein
MIASKRRDASILSRAGTEFEPGLALHLRRRGGGAGACGQSGFALCFHLYLRRLTMTDKQTADLGCDNQLRSDDVTSVAKEIWSKPEIADYQPVTVARGISYRIGDGISNLS